MQIANGIYQLSGHMNGLNSNTFVIDTEEGLVLIDTGYRPYYLDAQKKVLSFWGLENKKIIAVFLTHAHFDHAGNAHFYEEQGIPVYVGEKDRDALKSGGDRVMESIFGSRFTTLKNPVPVKDGQEFAFGGETSAVKMKVIDLSGHTAGAVGFLVDKDGKRILFTGDMFMISGASPSDEMELEIGYTGSVDYDAAANLASFKKLAECGMDIDVVAVGHRGVFYGDCKELFEKLYNLALETIAPQE